MIKTGIYSGSFNPIHIGHLALANWLCEYGVVDEVWFLVSPQNPMKDPDELLAPELRLEMVKAAIDGYDKFRADDIELRLPRPSYTIDTLNELKKKYPDRSFHLIVGADSWASIGRWKNAEELLSEFSLLVYPRKGYEVSIPTKYQSVSLVDAPRFDISSTMIRQGLAEGKDIRFFLPEAVRPFLLKK